MLNMNTNKTVRMETKQDNTLFSSLLGPSLIPVTASPLSGIKYDFDIADIGPSEDFQQLLQVLRMAQPEDEIHLHINSGGGSIYTAVQLVGAMTESNAKSITGHAEGIVASAATLLFLGCNQWKVSPFSSFMFHTSSTVEAGKTPDILKSIVAHKRHLNDVCGKLYKNFLTEEEIDNVLNKNDDMWLTAEEVNDRLAHLVKVEQQIADEEQAQTEKAMSLVEAALKTLDDEDADDITIEIPDVSMDMTKKEIKEIYEQLCDDVSQVCEDFVPDVITTKMTKQQCIDLYNALADDLIDEEK